MDKELENLLEDLESGEVVKIKYGECYAYSPDVVEELKQALKDLIFFNKVKTMLKQKDAVLRYVESEDCFATRTMMSGWYKLTPQFVDDNIREEIEPLPVLGKIKQLKEENAEYKKILEIIMKKPQAELSLIQLGEIKTYQEYLDRTQYWEGIYWDMIYTEEEFDLLKNKVLIK